MSAGLLVRALYGDSFVNKHLVIGTFIGLLLTAAVGYYFFITEAIPLPAGAIRLADTAAEPINLPTIDLSEGYSINFPGREDLIAHADSIQPHITVEAWDNLFNLNQFGRSAPSLRASSDCTFFPPTPGMALTKNRIEALKQGKQNILVVPLSMPTCFVRDSTIAIVYDEIFENKMAYVLGGKIKIERILEIKFDLLPDIFFSTIKLSRDDFPLLFGLGNIPAAFDKAGIVLVVSYDDTPPILPQDTVPGFAAGAAVISNRYILGFASRLTPQQQSSVVFVDTREPKYFAAQSQKTGFRMINAPLIPSNPSQSKFRPDFPLAQLAGSKVDLSQIPTDVDALLVLIGHDEHDAGPLWVLRELRLGPHRQIAILREGFKGWQSVETAFDFTRPHLQPEERAR